MTRLKSISVNGFKGHQDLEIPSSDINIITGRNNTGKTSFLEDINLLFNPSHIREYEENIDKLINVHQDTAVIQSEFRHNNGQQQLSEYKGNQRIVRELSLYKPDNTKVADYITEIILQQLQSVEISQLGRPSIASNLADIEKTTELIENFESDLDEYVKKSLDTVLTEDLLSDLASISLILSINEEIHPYIYIYILAKNMTNL